MTARPSAAGSTGALRPGRPQRAAAIATAPAPTPLDPLAGTASTQLVRLVRDAALRAGVALDRVSSIHGLDDRELRGELDRIPMRSLVELWQLLAGTGPGANSGKLLVRLDQRD